MTVLTLLFNEKKLQDYELAVGQRLTIGRNPDNDIIIDNPAVSGHHACVDSVASSFVIKDLNSTNGLFVNKQRVETHVLHHGDVVVIGKHNLSFSVLDNLDSVDNGKMENKTKPGNDVFFEDKTRFLDTREHRDLIKQSKEKNTKDSSKLTGRDNLDSKKGILATLWEKISGLFH